MGGHVTYRPSGASFKRDCGTQSVQVSTPAEAMLFWHQHSRKSGMFSVSSVNGSDNKNDAGLTDMQASSVVTDDGSTGCVSNMAASHD